MRCALCPTRATIVETIGLGSMAMAASPAVAGFVGTPMGIDIRKVLETGLAPVINTGIAHRQPGLGQIGAGIVRAPLACFEQALVAFAESIGATA
jgi:hypothetical protein